MTSFALSAMLKAKPGKEEDVAEFLRQAQPMVKEEPGTIAWFAVRLGAQEFGIFDAFHDEAGRQAHLNGKVAAALKEHSADLFSEPPVILKSEVIASKLPKPHTTPLEGEPLRSEPLQQKVS